MADTPRRIVLVGHCGPDAFALQSAVRSMVPGATVVHANTDEAVNDEIARADLLLVNRVLDGGFRSGSGLDIVRTISSIDVDPKPEVVLVSNFADAQEQARRAGARPGFGKRDLYGDAMRRSLEEALAARP
jgi:hypothetical protein